MTWLVLGNRPPGARIIVSAAGVGTTYVVTEGGAIARADGAAWTPEDDARLAGYPSMFLAQPDPKPVAPVTATPGSRGHWAGTDPADKPGEGPNPEPHPGKPDGSADGPEKPKDLASPAKDAPPAAPDAAVASGRGAPKAPPPLPEKPKSGRK